MRTSTRKIKIIHNRKNCIGCNSCVNIAPQCWEMDKKDGRAHLIGSKKKGSVYVGEIFECDLESNKASAEACPMQAIQIGNIK